jgi:hypothetical protein
MPTSNRKNPLVDRPSLAQSVINRGAATLPRFASPADSYPDPDPETLPPSWSESPSPSPNPDAEPVRAGDLPPRTATSSAGKRTPSGDPLNTAKVLAGLLLIVAGWVAWGGRRRGLAVRKPTREEANDITGPIARIMCRHLPMDSIGPDLADLGEAAAAISEYAVQDDNPLVARYVPEPEIPSQESYQ